MGVYHTNIAVLFSFIFILSGLVLFTNYFGSHRVFVLTASAMVFYSGFLLLLKYYFSFDLAIFTFLPNLVLIAGLNFLLLYLENRDRRLYLIISIVFLLIFLISSYLMHAISWFMFGHYLYRIAHSFWFFMLLLFLFLVIIMREKRQ
jgi:hypothetical protein